jgi:fatty acid desaturase
MHLLRTGRRASRCRGFGLTRHEFGPRSAQSRTINKLPASDCDGYHDQGDHRNDDVLARHDAAELSPRSFETQEDRSRRTIDELTVAPVCVLSTLGHVRTRTDPIAEFDVMPKPRPPWSQWVIASHLIVVLVAGCALALTRSDLFRLLLTLICGTSLFVLSTLVHEASHYNLARRRWLNELLGALAGSLLATPISAYRAVHMKHHQATNREADPFNLFNSRWMILFGAPTAIALAHGYAWRYLRGRALGRYLVEMCGILALASAIVASPRPVREWSLIGPLVVLALFQNIHILTGHLDLPAGKYHDTWQLVLPRWLSAWVLHNDHHLEHHIFPRLNWYELPALREKLTLEPDLPLQRVTFFQFFVEVFLTRRYTLPMTTTTQVTSDETRMIPA